MSLELPIALDFNLRDITSCFLLEESIQMNNGVKICIKTPKEYRYNFISVLTGKFPEWFLLLKQFQKLKVVVSLFLRMSNGAGIGCIGSRNKYG